MKINIKSIAILLLLGGAIMSNSGCKKFLEEKDPTNLSPQSFYTLPEHAEAGIAAVYSEIRFIGNGAGIFSNNWQMLDAPSGIQITETAQNSDLNNLYSLIYDGSNLHINQTWNGWYKVIAQANLVLDKVPGINPMDAAQKKRILGEASFLRAWSYFYLVRLWGDVPLILQPISGPNDPNFSPSRTPQEQVYNQIVSDLTSAEAAGLPFMDASGRVSTAAIKSELAKVYLTMAGQPLNKGVAYYKLAADKAKEVVDYSTSNPTTLGLFPTYAALHDAKNDNKVEHIFGIQYNDAAGAGNPLQSIYLPLHQPLVSKIDGIGTSIPTPEFFASYQTGDLRAKNREGFFFTDYYTNGSSLPLVNRGKPYIFKHFDLIANGTLGTEGTSRSDLNIPQIRYADILLVYAEAQNRADGAPNAAAYAAVNAIRTRAQLPALSGLAQTQFEVAVWRERWHELCYEGITWFDMLRLRKAYNESTNNFDEFVGHVNKSVNQALQTKNLLFPIPTPEIKNNPKLTQNTGY
ncbi:RagB/SusD family nutrient uptake outer membrane protein [Pedobacter mucosus]|uniref:RagB/SusD family nutrient uptake outer membrane protein n=1 Tax=Pedobacter mucosus TaxID=2895286 RepID=UPI001EE42ECF|nr:RagB/SusD family nutrient uptake outer membrane protein [Pedobacter mucosus]UKT62780.1 RagB/SusD family nutrient uptake outer membrane protein [Pedobacter mucosus]